MERFSAALASAAASVSNTFSHSRSLSTTEQTSNLTTTTTTATKTTPTATTPTAATSITTDTLMTDEGPVQLIRHPTKKTPFCLRPL